MEFVPQTRRGNLEGHSTLVVNGEYLRDIDKLSGNDQLKEFKLSGADCTCYISGLQWSPDNWGKLCKKILRIKQNVIHQSQWGSLQLCE